MALPTTDPLYGADDQPTLRRPVPNANGGTADQPIAKPLSQSSAQAYAQHVNPVTRSPSQDVLPASSTDTSGITIQRPTAGPFTSAAAAITNPQTSSPPAFVPTVKPVMTDDEIAAWKGYAGQPAITRPDPGAAATADTTIRRPMPQGSGATDLIARGVGTMVNGTPTFTYSPGSAGNSIPQGYVDATDERSSTPYSGSEGGVLSSANGGVAPTQDQAVQVAALRRPVPNGIQPDQPDANGNLFSASQIQRPVLPGSYDPDADARSSMSDATSIALKDPRSPLGIAARNIGVDTAADSRGKRSRAVIARQQLGQQQLDDLYRANAGALTATTQASEANARDRTLFANDQNTNATSLARAGLESNARLAAAEARANALGYSADSHADATRYAADARANTPKIDSASTAAAGRIYQQALMDGKSPDDAHAAVLGWLNARQQAVSSTSPSRGATTGLSPPSAAVQFLRDNPQYASHFDAKYGAGTSKQYLGAQ